MDVLDRNIAAYITNCLLGITDEPLNTMLQNSQPRSGSDVLKEIHQAVHHAPGHPAVMKRVQESFSNAVVKSLRQENERLRKHIEEQIQLLEEISEDMEKVSALLKELKEPERRVRFYRQDGYAIFEEFRGGELRKILATYNDAIPYVVEGLREKYPGIRIEEV